MSEHILQAHQLAEAQTIGAILLDGNSFAEVAGILSAEDFSDPRLQNLFTIAARHFAKGEALTLAGILAGAGNNPAVRDLALDLKGSIGTSAHIVADALQVQDAARKRTLAAAANRIAESAADPSTKFGPVLDEAQAALAGVADGPGIGGPKPLADGLGGYLRDLEARQKNGGGLRGLPTGLKSLDDILKGLRPGAVTVVAGTTSSGKTALAVQIADRVAEHCGPVLFFSAEMTAEELTERILSRRSGVDHDSLRGGTLSAADWSRLTQAAGEFSNGAGKRLMVDDMGGLTCGRIASSLARENIRGGAALLVVDHLQLVRPSGRKPSRYEQITDISGDIKSLALRFGVPVLLLSQLNRSSTRDARKPNLSDLRDSGAIEQDADSVVFIHRDQGARDQIDREATTLIVAKNRSGKLGEVYLHFDMDHQGFAEVHNE